MSFARKFKRQKGEPNKHRCCGEQMWHKAGYDTDTSEFWFCENCGKEKWIEKRGTDT